MGNERWLGRYVRALPSLAMGALWDWALWKFEQRIGGVAKEKMMKEPLWEEILTKWQRRVVMKCMNKGSSMG